MCLTFYNNGTIVLEKKNKTINNQQTNLMLYDVCIRLYRVFHNIIQKTSKKDSLHKNKNIFVYIFFSENPLFSR